MKNSMRAPIFMTLLKNAKNAQNGHHSIESTLLSQSLTVNATLKDLGRILLKL